MGEEPILLEIEPPDDSYAFTGHEVLDVDAERKPARRGMRGRGGGAFPRAARYAFITCV